MVHRQPQTRQLLETHQPYLRTHQPYLKTHQRYRQRKWILQQKAKPRRIPLAATWVTFLHRRLNPQVMAGFATKRPPLEWSQVIHQTFGFPAPPPRV